MKIRDKRREEIVAEYRSGGVSYRELEAIYGISTSTLHRWVQAAGAKKQEGREKSSTAGERSDHAGSEVKRLREELRRAELHNKLLNAMIDIAEEQMGVKIRKKPGAGQ